jgi:act minimal PKS acyl carrier protein
MAEYTIDDLVRTLRECAGEDEDADLSGDIMDVSFVDLGYDSLALFNTIAAVERDLGLTLAEDLAVTVPTPRVLLKEINGARG